MGGSGGRRPVPRKKEEEGGNEEEGSHCDYIHTHSVVCTTGRQEGRREGGGGGKGCCYISPFKLVVVVLVVIFSSMRVPCAVGNNSNTQRTHERIRRDGWATVCQLFSFPPSLFSSNLLFHFINISNICRPHGPPNDYGSSFLGKRRRKRPRGKGQRHSPHGPESLLDPMIPVPVRYAPGKNNRKQQKVKKNK